MNTEHSQGGALVDLDREEFYDSHARRITEGYISAAVAEVESDETQLDEAQAVFPPRDTTVQESAPPR